MNVIVSESSALTLIQKERQRQVLQEGFTFAHDDLHAAGEMADAAACYAMQPCVRPLTMKPRLWPWSLDWWKPSPDDRIKELVKAGALIVAEIERLQREQARKAAV